jgi:large subunit ribosomal protein L35
MPKMKTKKTAAKRFRKTKSGKFKFSKAFGAHLLTSKSPKRRRNIRQAAVVASCDVKNIKGMLPYG